ncbi:MAG: glutaredoxin 3 [Rhodobacteraceae bacterium]|nr:glutaredoxin 3 [Paracoccaceae bacterium]
MKNVEIYTTPICGYCAAAKRLLNGKSVSFAEIDVMTNPEKKAEMIKRANGGRTVPQIFIGDIHVGGFDDLNMLERQGKLDALLAG